MNSTTLRRSVLVGTALLLLIGGNAAFAAPGANTTTQPISFTVGSPTNPLGTVVDLGDQKYTVSGGQVVLAMIDGQLLDPGATLKFSLTAEVKGISTTGHANFALQGMVGGQPISVSGNFPISSKQTLANVLPGPSGSCTGKEANSCSELPVFFAGTANVQVKTGSAAAPSGPGPAPPTPAQGTTMELENPYFNPFGAPIVLTSADGSIFIVTTYNVGNITWKGSSVTGPITGTLGTSTPISGTIVLNTTETENLLAGTAVDRGVIAFESMTPATLNTQGTPGTYTGTSYIPLPTPGNDCSAAFGFPGLGICTQTGFNSVGQFTTQGGPPGPGPAQQRQTIISGSYVTTWTTPALMFSSTTAGSVTTQTGK